MPEIVAPANNSETNISENLETSVSEDHSSEIDPVDSEINNLLLEKLAASK